MDYVKAVAIALGNAKRTGTVCYDSEFDILSRMAEHDVNSIVRKCAKLALENRKKKFDWEWNG